MPTQLVPRVAARHVRRADLVQRDARENVEVVLQDVPYTPNLEVILSDGGTVTDLDVRRLLRQRKPPVVLSSLWFCLGFTTAGMNEVLWEGIADSGETVSGRLVLHAGVEPDHVTVWSEIVLDPSEDEQLGGHARQGRVPVADTQGRFEEVARLARGLVRDLREGRLPLHDVVARLVAIVDLAEADESDAAIPIGSPGTPRYDRRAGAHDDGAGAVRLLERRLERIGQLARDLLVRAKGEPTFGHSKILAGIAKLVALAERELPSAED